MPPDLLLLDVTDPDNRDAVQAALDDVGSVDPIHEPFVRRVLTDCSDPLLNGQARVLLAAFEQERGRTSEAAELFRSGLPRVWGSRTRAEANALVNYAAVCVTQRRSFEGLALLRRACEYAEAKDNAAALALAKAYLARTLVEVEDWPRLDPLLDEIEALLARLDDGPRQYVEMVAVTTAIEAAFRRGDSGRARAVKDRLELLSFDRDERGRPFHRALVLATEGRRTEAREQIAIVRARRDGSERYRAALLDVELACFDDDVPEADWRAAGERLLDLLAASSPEGHSAGDRLVMAGRLARCLTERGGLDDLAQRAMAVAAAGVIERIVELETFLRALPQLCFAGPEEQVILDDYRTRFLARHAALLDAVQRLVGAAPEDARALDAVPTGHELWVCVCAWCRLLRGPDGLWLSIERLDVPVGPVNVTHGICQRCRTRELGNLTGSR